MNRDVQAVWTEPMLAQPTRIPNELGSLRSGEWVYERKLDGLRCLAVRDRESIELWSRNRLSYSARFPEIVAALRSVPADRFVFDGELVAFEGGRTSFALLQNQSAATPVVYAAFDLLHLLGSDTRFLPLNERAGLLAKAIEGVHPSIRLTERLEGDPGILLATACERGWEGLIAKRAASAYRPGRSPDWRKMKCSARQELVIAGWTDPSGSRLGFGALLVGYYDTAHNLRYAGRVGTGFDERVLRRLHSELRALEIDRRPFVDAVPGKGLHWARPTLVAEVEFTEWTRDGRLRHPRFAGLRPDKQADDVLREDGASGVTS